MNNILKQIGLVFGTILLLIVSIAWVDWIASLRIKYGISQILFTLTLTVITLLFFIFLKPFDDEHGKTPGGIEKAILEDRTIRFPLMTEI